MSRSLVTDAVVLAAGEGRRLRPLTRYQPKPMLPLANRPVVEYVLGALAEVGVERVVLVVGHQRTRVQDRLSHEHRGMKLSYVEQRSQLGSGHALEQAAEAVAEEFVVVNGDNVIDATMVHDVVETYRRSAPVATVAVAHSDTPRDYGVVLTENSNVTAIHDCSTAEERSCVNAGVYVFDHSIFDALAATTACDGELRLPDAIRHVSGPVAATSPNGVWFDPSYPWDALRATFRLLATSPTILPGDESIDDSAHVHDTAVVEEPTLVGPGCEIGAGAVVRAGTCLRENVRIGANATVERSILDTDVTVGANALLRDTILGPGVRIGSGTVSPGRSATVVVNGRRFLDRRLGGVIADRATVGANVTIVPGTRIAPEATVEHGATVRDQVPKGAQVIG